MYGVAGLLIHHINQHSRYGEPWIQRTFATGNPLTNSREIASCTMNPWIQRTICYGTKGFIVSRVHCTSIDFGAIPMALEVIKEPRILELHT